MASNAGVIDGPREASGRRNTFDTMTAEAAETTQTATTDEGVAVEEGSRWNMIRPLPVGVHLHLVIGRARKSLVAAETIANVAIVVKRAIVVVTTSPQ